jgi:hypothetical protein
MMGAIWGYESQVREDLGLKITGLGSDQLGKPFYPHIYSEGDLENLRANTDNEGARELLDLITTSGRSIYPVS